jgi:hypothetical protein
MKARSIAALCLLQIPWGCAKSAPASPPDTPNGVNECARGGGMMGGGMMHGDSKMGDGMMMGRGMMIMGSADGGATMESCPMMDGGSIMSGCPMMDAGSMKMGGMMTMGHRMGARELSVEATQAWRTALDEEYRAEAVYASLVTKFGTRPSFRVIAQSDRHQAWILESLGMAHGLELPTNSSATPAIAVDLKTTAAACRAGLESEKKAIALYEELLKKDLPVDLRRAFEHLRAASADHHLHDFEACR